MFKVVDNFLEKEEFKIIQKDISSNYFPWFFEEEVVDSKDDLKTYYFTHSFFKPYYHTSHFLNMWDNLLNKIECNSLIRIKGNLFLGEKKHRKHKAHKDYPYKHKGCLLYINDNNGYTYFKEGKVKPKENRVVFFDPSELHSSSVCSDQKKRITVNFNYF